MLAWTLYNYLKDEQIEEAEEQVYTDANDKFQLPNHSPGVLQRECQVLALIVDLDDGIPHVMQGHLAIPIHIKHLQRLSCLFLW